MKKALWIFIILIILFIIVFAMIPDAAPGTDSTNNTATNNTPTGNTGTISTDENGAVQPSQSIPLQVIPISHATAILDWAGTAIYLDPTGSPEVFDGKVIPNIILVTDIHGDHLSTSTLEAITINATLIVPQAVKDLLPTSLATKAKVLKNGESITEQGFKISALPMYNLPVTPDSRHTKGRGNGYLIESDGFQVYVAGDTSGTPEMEALKNIDLAFVPMNPPFTMTVEEAAKAVLAFKPRIVYPFHYRAQAGMSDTAKFKQLVNAGNPDIEVVLANWYPTN